MYTFVDADVEDMSTRGGVVDGDDDIGAGVTRLEVPQTKPTKSLVVLSQRTATVDAAVV